LHHQILNDCSLFSLFCYSLLLHIFLLYSLPNSSYFLQCKTGEESKWWRRSCWCLGKTVLRWRYMVGEWKEFISLLENERFCDRVKFLIMQFPLYTLRIMMTLSSNLLFSIMIDGCFVILLNVMGIF
ncbi:hypothetical protein KSS87_014046, partial [Heliosperma pusillum]